MLQRKRLKMEIGATSLLEPNLGSTLAEFQRRVAESGGDMSLLKMSLCGAFDLSSSSSPPPSIGSSQHFQHDHNHQQHQHQHTDLYHYYHTIGGSLRQPHEAANENFTAIPRAFSKPLTRLVLDHVLEPMQSIEGTLDYYFSEIWTRNGDERTSKLPLMSAGPWKLIYATLVYLYLIKWLLPRTMRKFRALELNWCIRGYNLLMVLSNLYAFYHGARILSWGLKCFGCEVIDHKDYSPQAMELLHYGWLFFLSRIVEWLDTIFFVLRKKERQVTKLHVFHHSFVPTLCWFYLKFHPGYSVAFFPFVNTFVHTIMYTYYLLATFGPKVQAYLWWKKYLTSLQIAQFVLILVQLATIPLSASDKCQYPRAFLYAAFAGAILFLWLFYTYYVDTYRANSRHQAAAARSFTSSTSSSSSNGNGIANNGAGSPTNSLAGRDGGLSGASSVAAAAAEAAVSLARRTVADCRRLPLKPEGSSESFSDFIDNAIGAAERRMSLGKRAAKSNKLD